MKKLLMLTLAALLLAACGNDETNKEVEKKSDTPVAEDKTKEPTREEITTKMKEESKEYSFVEISGGSVPVDTKIKLTGKVTNLTEEGVLGKFTLTSKEGDGYGMYSVWNMIGSDVKDGDTVTLYGTLQDKDESGMPAVNASVIEKQ